MPLECFVPAHTGQKTKSLCLTKRTNVVESGGGGGGGRNIGAYYHICMLLIIYAVKLRRHLLSANVARCYPNPSARVCVCRRGHNSRNVSA